MREKNIGGRVFAPDVIVSNDTRKTGLNNNDLIIGGSGSGKTGGYIYNLLLNPYGSMIVSDTKGLLHKKFKGYLEERGYKVQVLDFVNPENSAAYNPLSYIRMNQHGEPNEADIKKLATTIMPQLDARDPFWEKAAIRYIGILIGYVLEALPREEHNMFTVCYLHQAMQRAAGKIALEEWCESNPSSYTTRKYTQMKESKEAEKMWVSIMEFVNEALDVFDYKEYQSIFEGENPLEIGKLGHERTVVFLTSSDNDTSMHVLSDIFFSQALQTLILEADRCEEGRLPVPCRLVLDDFASAAKIERFDNIISIIRSREISVSIIIQSLSQLTAMYTNAQAQTILNNCSHVLYLSGKDPETTTYIADNLNQMQYSVLRLPRNKAVLLEEGAAGRIVNKLEPYSGQPIDVNGGVSI